MKQRREVPYEIKRRPRGGVNYIAHCATKGCRETVTIGAPKLLPDGVVCNKITGQGWEPDGFLRRDVPRRFIGPECIKAKKAKPSPKESPMQQHAIVVPPVGEEPIKMPTFVKISIAAYTSGREGRQVHIQIPNDVMAKHDLQEGDYILPQFTHAGLNEKPKLQISLHRRVAQPPSDAGFVKLVRSERYKGGCIARSTTSPASRYIANQGWLFGATEVELEVEGPSTWRTPTPFIPSKPVSEAGGGSKAQNPARTTGKRVSRASEATKGFSVSDGKELCELLSGWLKWMRAQGWQVNLKIDENGKIEMGIHQRYTSD